MSHGNRRKRPTFIEATLIILTISACVVLISAIAYELGIQKERRDNQPYQYAESAADRAQSTCVRRSKSAMAECIIEQVSAANDTARSEQDLKAQQQMALWALLMLVVSVVGLGVTVWALFYIRETLTETRRMARDTEDMAKASAEATCAMIRQNDISRLQYLSIKKPNIMMEIVGSYLEMVEVAPVQYMVKTFYRNIAIRCALKVVNVSDQIAIIRYFKYEGVGFSVNGITEEREVDKLLKPGEEIFLCPAGIYTQTVNIVLGHLFMNGANRDAVKADPPNVRVCVHYEDISGNLYELSYQAAATSLGFEGYVRTGGKAYNYDKEII